jgi:outer membrane protein OmpA-like peptidoglycan-associated protein
MRRSTLAAALLASLIVPARGEAGADPKGSHDHPLIPRFAGSQILSFSEKAFDQQDVVVEPLGDAGSRGSIHAEGKVTTLAYKAPGEASIAQVFRNYENALKEAGFRTIYSCSAKECGTYEGFFKAVDLQFQDGGTIVPLDQDHQRYLAAFLDRPQGGVHAMVYVSDCQVLGPSPYVVLRVVEEKPMQQTMVKVDAAEMAKSLGASGRVALYGIYFDFDKADVRSDSKEALDEIAKLLRSDPALKLYVVGHTDNQGAADYNMTLSQKRANAVVATLVAQYGIAQARLASQGVGPYAPVASNDSEDGRAKNRRVELVKR